MERVWGALVSFRYIGLLPFWLSILHTEAEMDSQGSLFFYFIFLNVDVLRPLCTTHTRSLTLAAVKVENPFFFSIYLFIFFVIGKAADDLRVQEILFRQQTIRRISCCRTEKKFNCEKYNFPVVFKTFFVCDLGLIIIECVKSKILH